MLNISKLWDLGFGALGLPCFQTPVIALAWLIWGSKAPTITQVSQISWILRKSQSMFIEMSRKVQRSKCHFFTYHIFTEKNSDINIDSMASPLLRICLLEVATDHGWCSCMLTIASRCNFLSFMIFYVLRVSDDHQLQKRPKMVIVRLTCWKDSVHDWPSVTGIPWHSQPWTSWTRSAAAQCQCRFQHGCSTADSLLQKSSVNRSWMFFKVLD